MVDRDSLWWWEPCITAYRKWLERDTSEANAVRWARRLNNVDSATVEGALAEACVWDYLTTSGIELHSQDFGPDGGLDFSVVASGVRLYIEVTAISTGQAERRTGLPIELDGEARNVGLLTNAIKNDVANKSGQIGQADYPVVVFVVVFHWQASTFCIRKEHISDCLVGTPSVSFRYNRETGEMGDEATPKVALDNSLFAKVSKAVDLDGRRRLQPLRRNVSGEIVGGFHESERSPVLLGLEHHDPIHQLDLAFGFGIPVCRLAELADGTGVQYWWSD